LVLIVGVELVLLFNETVFISLGHSGLGVSVVVVVHV